MADKDLQSIQTARDLVEAAHRAQSTVAAFDQAKIDSICEAMAIAAQAQSFRLATLAHEETGYGNPADKNVKNLFAAVDVHNYFRNLKTVGVVRDTGSVVEIAAPRGVVAAIIPSTNPTSTAIFKILIAIKSRNAIVLSPHPSATRCVVEVANVMREAGVKAGLPADGFGVGPGNVPAFVERNADVPKAVRDILAGKCFDFGTICASEQAIVADAAVDKQVREQLKAQGAYFLDQSQTEQLAKLVVTPNRTLNPKIVGKPATTLAEWAGIGVPPNTRCLIAEVGGVGREHPLSIEKLSPILAYYIVNSLEEGSRRCDEILHYGGMGHTASIHTRNRDAALQYGVLMPAARVIVNSPSTHGAIGFSTALAPSMTLGCGSWGGNVTSDNISPLHLMDIKRVAFETRPVTSAEPVQARISTPLPQSTPSYRTAAVPPQIDRAAIADLVDKFLSARPQVAASQNAPASPPPAPAVKTEPAPPPQAKSNGHKAADFVCEEDVRRAITNGEKIFISAKTIITPSARDLGNEREVFAKGN